MTQRCDTCDKQKHLISVTNHPYIHDGLYCQECLAKHNNMDIELAVVVGNSAKMNNRLSTTLQILDILTTYAKMYPDMRFHQLLSMLDIIQKQHAPTEDNYHAMRIQDDFFTENEDILKRITSVIEAYRAEF